MRWSIHLPPQRILLGYALGIGLFMTATFVGWALLAEGRVSWPTLGASLLVTGALFALIGGTISLMHRVNASGWTFATPHPTRWLAYYGSWSLVGLVIGLGRLTLLEAGSPAPLALSQSAFVLVVCVYVSLVTVALLENQAMFRESISRKQATSVKAVRFLFGAHEAFVQARDRRRHEALTFIERRLDPELKDLQARLPLEDSPEVLESVLRRLERLRDVEVREVSHLLHPSIIDMGLVPALRALVRHRASELPIRLELEGLSSQDVSSRVSLQLYRIVELALDLARPLAVRDGVIGLWRLDDGSLRLEIVGQGAGYDAQKARELGAPALLDARVAMLRGAWGFDVQGAERLVFWVDVPDPSA